MEPTAPPPHLTLAHLSDVHFGRISDERVVGALVDEVNDADLDLVVVSGDLTQRARRNEFKAARAMLDAFGPPVIVVPGNHDVRAWWHNPFDRLWRSSKRYRKYISEDVTPQFAADGLAAFGLNSAHGWTIKGGRIRPEHVDEMEAFFGRQPDDAFRVLTVHHHLLLLDGLGNHDISRGARLALEAAQSARVDLVLCGHLHTSHVAPVELAPAGDAGRGHRLVIASAGTATSNRGRGTDRGVNFYNWIEIGADQFSVCERQFDPDTGRFETERTTTFDRDTTGRG
jgi:3',5'-cyclic AMP phosphodiesterase CpdA